MSWVNLFWSEHCCFLSLKKKKSFILLDRKYRVSHGLGKWTATEPDVYPFLILNSLDWPWTCNAPARITGLYWCSGFLTPSLPISREAGAQTQGFVLSGKLEQDECVKISKEYKFMGEFSGLTHKHLETMLPQTHFQGRHIGCPLCEPTFSHVFPIFYSWWFMVIT